MSNFKTKINQLIISGAVVSTIMVSVFASSTLQAEEDSGVSDSLSRAVNAEPLTRFVLDCWDRAYNGDPKVYDDCFTEDFKMRGPETELFSNEPDGSSKGREAIRSYHDMNHGDAQAWGKVRSDPIWHIEANDSVVRIMRWVGSDIKNGAYGPINNIPKDRVVTLDGVFIDKLRDGKIYEMFWAYDTSKFMSDIAGGDIDQIAEATRVMAKMAEKMKQAAAKGKSVMDIDGNYLSE